jgi:hypothetical protein
VEEAVRADYTETAGEQSTRENRRGNQAWEAVGRVLEWMVERRWESPCREDMEKNPKTMKFEREELMQRRGLVIGRR